MGYNELPLVSRDYNGCPLSSIVDGLSTMMVGQRMAKGCQPGTIMNGAIPIRVVDLGYLHGQKRFVIVEREYIMFDG
jgi:hypothetical protein